MMNPTRQHALACAVEVMRYAAQDSDVLEVAAVFLTFLEGGTADDGRDLAMGHAIRRHLDRTKDHPDWRLPGIEALKIVDTATQYVAFMDASAAVRRRARKVA